MGSLPAIDHKLRNNSQFTSKPRSAEGMIPFEWNRRPGERFASSPANESSRRLNDHRFGCNRVIPFFDQIKPILIEKWNYVSVVRPVCLHFALESTHFQATGELYPSSGQLNQGSTSGRCFPEKAPPGPPIPQMTGGT